MLERLYKISERGSTVKQEVIGGLTTFLAMSYIIFVNPSILGIGKSISIPYFSIFK